LAQYWQNTEMSSQSASQHTFARRINEIKKIIISHSKVDLVWNISQQLTIESDESLVNEIKNLKNSGVEKISVEARIKTWQLFLQNSLFDEMLLFIQPVVAGQETKLFADVGAKTTMQLISSRVFEMVLLSCIIKKMCREFCAIPNRSAFLLMSPRQHLQQSLQGQRSSFAIHILNP
jgi:dihydrofolate reductase